jgi:hypothetical protein
LVKSDASNYGRSTADAALSWNVGVGRWSEGGARLGYCVVIHVVVAAGDALDFLGCLDR